MTRSLLIAGLALASCNQNLPPSVNGVQSFAVTLTNPAPDPMTNAVGGPSNPVTVSDLTFDLQALDTQGQHFGDDIDVDVFVSFAGNKIGVFTDCGKKEDQTPLATLHLAGGAATGQTVHLPRAYGITNLWVEDARDRTDLANATFATGASPPIYFANPTIPDVQMPLDLSSPTATYCSAFDGKHVIVDHACKPDPDHPNCSQTVGQLVVTSVFIDSYVVADTGAVFDSNGNFGFNHMFVYSFGKPAAAIVPGRVLGSLEGNVSKFVGFTELNFPLQTYTDTVDPHLLPPVYTLQKTDRPGVNLAANERLLRLAGATVSASGTVCPIDTTSTDWVKYNQFGINFGDGGCSGANTFTVVLPSKMYGSFDPLQAAGKPITVVGMLQNLSGQKDATTPPTLCHTNNDCASLSSTTCVEGTCKNGEYDFWMIKPRCADTMPFPPTCTSADITVGQ